MAMKVSEIRRQKAARVSDVVGMRDAIREKFEVRMFADIETSPLDSQTVWIFVGPGCEAMTVQEHQQMADTIAQSWTMFDAVELIDQQGNVLARSRFDEVTDG